MVERPESALVSTTQNKLVRQNNSPPNLLVGMNSRSTQKPPTVEQLRDDIDSGRTGDKVDHPDPAAVPLGADAEAGGNPPTADQLAEARKHELGHGRDRRRPNTDGSQRASKNELRSLVAELTNEPVPRRLIEAARALQKAMDFRKKGYSA